MSNTPCKSAIDIVEKCSRNKDWCMCMFFSVDIAGATAFKATVRDENTKLRDIKWCREFERFYVDFPNQFLGKYVMQNQADPDLTLLTKPVPWKYVGDEILFFVPILKYRHTVVHVKYFAETLMSYNKGFEDDKKQIRCKGTAWLAGFPLNNRIILIDEDTTGNRKKAEPKHRIDFIGSSIDCGFRLTKFSTPRKLVVSFELIWMLAEERNESISTDSSWMKIWFDGKRELKGVNQSRPYPIFWIDMFHKNDGVIIEDKWLPLQQQCEKRDIATFCEEFERNEPAFIKPFIAGDVNCKFNIIPEEYEKRLDEVKEFYRNK